MTDFVHSNTKPFQMTDPLQAALDHTNAADCFTGSALPSLHQWMVPDPWSPQPLAVFRGLTHTPQRATPYDPVQTDWTPPQRPSCVHASYSGSPSPVEYERLLPTPPVDATEHQRQEGSPTSETSSGFFSSCPSSCRSVVSDLDDSLDQALRGSSSSLPTLPGFVLPIPSSPSDSGCEEHAQSRTSSTVCLQEAAPPSAVLVPSPDTRGTRHMKDASTDDSRKPPESYLAIVGKALLNSSKGKLILVDIYDFFLENYPYFRSAPPSWKNAIRHNLSVNECFVKAGRSENGRGYYWAIHPACVAAFKRGDFRRREARRLVHDKRQSIKPQAKVVPSVPVANHGATMTSVPALRAHLSAGPTYQVATPSYQSSGCSNAVQLNYGYVNACAAAPNFRHVGAQGYNSYNSFYGNTFPEPYQSFNSGSNGQPQELDTTTTSFLQYLHM